MTGPEHYRLAHDWLAEAADQYERIEDPAEAGRLAAAIAHGHAQLAATAATAELDAFGMNDGSATGRTEGRAAEWTTVFGPMVRDTLPREVTGG